MSDALLIARTLDETLRLRDGLSEWAYAPSARCDGYEYESEESSEWPRLTFWSGALATDAEQASG